MIDMDEKTKTAVLILVAAILISAIGSWAIAFACGYLVATLVHSPGFDRQLVQQKLLAFWHTFKPDKPK